MGAAQVLCSCLHDARVQRANKTWYLLARSDNAPRRSEATSWHAPRSGGRNAPRDLMSLGTPQCEKVAALSLCSSFRKSIHLQRLCLQVKETCKHESFTHAAKTKSFATCDAPCDSINFPHNGKQNLLLSSPAARDGEAWSTVQGAFM